MGFVLMPSEIARLVLGYLTETGCEKSSKTFLEESPFLKEFSQGLSRGITYQTKINNKTLCEYINSCFLSLNDSSTIIGTSQTDVTLDETIKKSIPGCSKENSFEFKFNESMKEQISKIIDEKLEASLNVSCIPNTPKISKVSSLDSVSKFSNISHSSPRRKLQTPRKFRNSTLIESVGNNSSLSDNNLNNNNIPTPTSANALNINSSPSSFINDSPSSYAAFIDPGAIAQTTYNYLLKNTPIHDKLVTKINQKIEGENSKQSEPIKSVKLNQQIDQTEYPDYTSLLDNFDVGKVFYSIEQEPEYTKMVDSIVETEINSTPFKCFGPSSTSNLSTCSSEPSLNTPRITFNTPNDLFSNGNSNQFEENPVVKNFTEHFKTPQKITLYAYDSDKRVEIENASFDKISDLNNSALLEAIEKAKIPQFKQFSHNIDSQTTDNSTRVPIPPIFQNRHLISHKNSLGRMKSQQQEVREAKNLTQKLTTTIELATESGSYDTNETAQALNTLKPVSINAPNTFQNVVPVTNVNSNVTLSSTSANNISSCVSNNQLALSTGLITYLIPGVNGNPAYVFQSNQLIQQSSNIDMFRPLANSEVPNNIIEHTLAGTLEESSPSTSITPSTVPRQADPRKTTTSSLVQNKLEILKGISKNSPESTKSKSEKQSRSFENNSATFKVSHKNKDVDKSKESKKVKETKTDKNKSSKRKRKSDEEEHHTKPTKTTRNSQKNVETLLSSDIDAFLNKIHE